LAGVKLDGKLSVEISSGFEDVAERDDRRIEESVCDRATDMPGGDPSGSCEFLSNFDDSYRGGGTRTANRLTTGQPLGRPEGRDPCSKAV